MRKRKLPIGIQDFVSIREDDYLYVDKTPLVHRLVQEGKGYFLSRPRRFGKSLLCSTFGAYLEGRRELFAGLALERLDLNAGIYNSVEGLVGIIENHLTGWEAKYGKPRETTIPGRFFGAIERACVIIDEYDKPLLSTIGNPRLHEEYKQFLKPFFGTLKSSDAHLKFVFITGVTKFGPAAGSSSTQSVRPGQVSVFSDLNQLIDLSLDREYAALCGITEAELLNGFRPEIDGIELPARDFADYRADPDRPLPVIYQSGYLTIKSYDKRRFLYTLGYPNAEVERGFLFFVLPSYSSVSRYKIGVEFDKEEKNIGRWFSIL